MLNCWYTLKQSLFTAIQESLGWNGPWENETNHQQSRGGLWLAAKKGNSMNPISNTGSSEYRGH